MPPDSKWLEIPVHICRWISHESAHKSRCQASHRKAKSEDKDHDDDNGSDYEYGNDEVHAGLVPTVVRDPAAQLRHRVRKDVQHHEEKAGAPHHYKEEGQDDVQSQHAKQQRGKIVHGKNLSPLISSTS